MLNILKTLLSLVIVVSCANAGGDNCNLRNLSGCIECQGASCGSNLPWNSNNAFVRHSTIFDKNNKKIKDSEYKKQFPSDSKINNRNLVNTTQLNKNLKQPVKK
ncbi:MAG: hypothetical protein IJ848_03620 [Alphaproteobacteria bacterium]|nr:hypothetical protein [Alphaproteobacteria bacterium]